MKADEGEKRGLLSSDLLWFKGFQSSLKGMKGENVKLRVYPIFPSSIRRGDV